MIRLGPEWTDLLDAYRREHSDPRNRFCHAVGIPLIVGSLPVALVGLGLPLALSMFALGWGLQFAGHWFEGNDPAFFEDPRNLVVGLIWWIEKLGLPVQRTVKSEVPAEK